MMDAINDLYDAWRVLNLVLAAVGGGILTFKAGRQWPVLDVQAKFLYVSGISFCATYVWSLIEVLAEGVPGGPRVLLATLPLVWAIIAGALPPSPERQRALEAYRQKKYNRS